MEVRPTQRGFSVIEVLIASAIFLLIGLGILPLFAQAIRKDMPGRDATEVSNLGKTRMEEMLQVPFNSLQVPDGELAACTAEYWSALEKKWKPAAAPDPANECLSSAVDVSDLGGDAALWVRT